MATSSLVAVAYLNHGRWVAHCPRPGCTNAEAFGVMDDGQLGGLRSDHFHCRTEEVVDHVIGGLPVRDVFRYGGCGLRCAVEWPANIADIEALVMPRPVPASRNWQPGESLTDLLRENVANGIVPNDDLEIHGTQVVSGRLPSWSPLQIEG